MVTGRAERLPRMLPGICILFFVTLATLTVHAVISSAAAAAPEVTGLAASPVPYNPDGKKRLKITFKLSESAHVKVSVVKTRILMRKSRTMGAGTVSFSWDGRKRSGNKANSGTYKLVVQAYNHNGRGKKSTTFTVSRRNPPRAARFRLNPGRAHRQFGYYVTSHQ